MLVDDERRLVTALRRGLAAEGFEVDVAFDGVTGQTLAEHGDFDAIILDIMMPGKNGIDVCGALRGSGIDTPILMLTAKDSQIDEARALNIGADDYLTKPFHYVVLVARLKALLRRTQKARADKAAAGGSAQLPAPRPTGANDFSAGADDIAKTPRSQRELVVGDLRVLPAEQRVYRGETEVELTAKEFAILTYLARRKGEVVSKENLIDELWDFAAPAAPNVVEVHVSSLRKKIDAPFSRRSIRTVRGAGYRLEEDI